MQSLFSPSIVFIFSKNLFGCTKTKLRVGNITKYAGEGLVGLLIEPCFSLDDNFVFSSLFITFFYT